MAPRGTYRYAVVLDHPPAHQAHAGPRASAPTCPVPSAAGDGEGGDLASPILLVLVIVLASSCPSSFSSPCPCVSKQAMKNQQKKKKKKQKKKNKEKEENKEKAVLVGAVLLALRALGDRVSSLCGAIFFRAVQILGSLGRPHILHLRLEIMV